MPEHTYAPRPAPRIAYRDSSFRLQSGRTPAPRSSRPAELPVSIADPALRVVTDFSWEWPVSIEIDRSIDEALQCMISAGVRALLVMRGDAVVGLVTSYDIQGERPLQLLRSSNYTRHDEIEVGDIMTPWTGMLTLDWSVVESARVHYLEELISQTSATHVPLIERTDRGGVLVRGLLSRARLERQLGHPITATRQRATLVRPALPDRDSSRS